MKKDANSTMMYNVRDSSETYKQRRITNSVKKDTKSNGRNDVCICRNIQQKKNLEKTATNAPIIRSCVPKLCSESSD